MYKTYRLDDGTSTPRPVEIPNIDLSPTPQHNTGFLFFRYGTGNDPELSVAAVKFSDLASQLQSDALNDVMKCFVKDDKYQFMTFDGLSDYCQANQYQIQNDTVLYASDEKSFYLYNK